MTEVPWWRISSPSSVRRTARAALTLIALSAFSLLPANAATLHLTDDTFVDFSKPNHNNGSRFTVVIGTSGGDRRDYHRGADKPDKRGRDDPDRESRSHRGHDERGEPYLRDHGRGESHGFAKFDLSTLPDGISGTAIAKATLRLWVSAVRREGSLTLHRVETDWDEDSLTSANSPGLGEALSTAWIMASDQKNYVTFDITSEVRRWVDDPSTNHGIAFTPIDVRFVTDSKENIATSRPMEVEVALAGNRGSGVLGSQGLPGLEGPQGPAGPQGVAGADGAPGPQGPPGPEGPQGPAGPQGVAGADGAPGPQGPAGLAGADGADGAPGPQGPPGPEGPQGPQGVAGADGAQGPAGPRGPAGADGAPGPAGANGADGAAGPQGPPGPAGPRGPAGPQGMAGADGAPGPAGADGAPGAQGPPGPQGEPGTPGSWEKLGVQTANGNGQIDFTLPAGFITYELRVIGLVPATDNVGLKLRFSNDGGVTFAAGGSDYSWFEKFGSADQSNTADSAIEILTALHTTKIGSAAGEHYGGTIRIYGARD
ncbi:MAG: DNRLRE domain-containing protein, partial [Acidiferrobacterales bacterium]